MWRNLYLVVCYAIIQSQKLGVDILLSTSYSIKALGTVNGHCL